MSEGHKVNRDGASLIERAAALYDFGAALRGPAHPAVAVDAPRPAPVEPERSIPAANTAPRRTGTRHAIDTALLQAGGFIDPDGPVSSLSEEFRIIKRQLLARAFAPLATTRDRLILVSSAHPGDGKTSIAVNLALSMSAESDFDVLLVDGDFGKPSICGALGLPADPGLMDALADPAVNIADCILATDRPSLAVLPAGRSLHNDSEILASERTRMLLDRLVADHPRRIVLFDSPPALAASAAAEFARHVGLVLMVVRADRTSDAALRDAVQLLSACPNIQAVLNGVKFSSSGRLFGAYYGRQG